MRNQIFEIHFLKAYISDLTSLIKVVSVYVHSAELVQWNFPKTVFSLKLLPEAEGIPVMFADIL